MTTPLTGDATKNASVKTIALTLPQPVVLKSELANINHPINDAAKSGKQRGSTVIMLDAAKYTLVCAEGTHPNSPWVNLGDGTTKVTPA